MKIIKKFNDFLNEAVEISDLPLIFSDRLLADLKTIKHKIAYALIELHNNNSKLFNVTFIDKHPDLTDTVTQIQVNKAKLLLNDDDLKNLDNLYNLNHDVYKKYRSDIKIGRLVTRIFDDKFPRNKVRGYSDDIPNDLESFVNLYKITDTKLFNNFEIVEGNDITYWYHHSKYCTNEGTLGNSCMSNARYLTLYKENPDKIKMVILHPKDDKDTIKGRALLWHLDKPENRIYMDRIYTNDYSDEQLFISYAIKNNWLYKSEQTYGDEYIVDPTINKSKDMRLFVNVKPVEYNNYPYLDTLCYYNLNNGILTNKDEENEYPYCLVSTNGNLNSNDNYDDPDNYEYSRYHGENIPRDEARYCEIGEDWVYSNEAIYVSNTNGKYSIPDNEDIVHSKYSEKWFLRDKTIYSELLEDYIFIDSVRYIYKDLTSSNSDITHKKEIEKMLNKDEVIKYDNKYYYNNEENRKKIKKLKKENKKGEN